MTLQEILSDIHALREDLETYERKYGVLSETFYESYMSGEEPVRKDSFGEESSWVLDWSDWAGVYKIWLRRQELYRKMIETLRSQSPSLMQVIEKTARHEPISIPS